jgi:hypothetical protein
MYEGTGVNMSEWGVGEELRKEIGVYFCISASFEDVY